MRDFLTEMLYALTSAYSHKDHDNRRRGSPVETNIGKLFSVFAWGLNTVQEQADLIKLWDDLDYACGSVLDRYGANFGVKRFGADDTFYRLLIKVKLLSQLSGGDVDTVVRAASALFDVEEQDIFLKELFPAKIRILVDSSGLDGEHRALLPTIMRFFKRIIAAGVGFDMGFRTEIDTKIYAGAWAAAGHRYVIFANIIPHEKLAEPLMRGAAAQASTRRHIVDARPGPHVCAMGPLAVGGAGAVQGKTYRIEAK